MAQWTRIRHDEGVEAPSAGNAITPAVAATGSRRRHVTGQATRELLLITAERLFAAHGVAGVSVREIQVEAGQSNPSVVNYHFGSKDGLVRALLEYRYHAINARRTELLEQAHSDSQEPDAHAAVWLIVRPLVESIDAGELFVPFLAKLGADTRTAQDFLPFHSEDSPTYLVNELVPGLLHDLPERARRGRSVQLYNSVLNLLGELADREQPISDAQLSNYVDGWVGMLTAPLSAETVLLLEQERSGRDATRGT